MRRQKKNDIFLTRDQARAVDRIALERYKIPGLILMENAGSNAARLLLEWDSIEQLAFKKAIILCGQGNNGGDGLVIARHLSNAGKEVEVALFGNPQRLPPDATVNLAIIRAMGLPLLFDPEERIFAQMLEQDRSDSIVIDALLGTGFTGVVRSPLAEVIERINGAKKGTVIAIDAPSGLDCDTGEPGGVAIRADYTFTFVARKVGFQRGSAKRFVGSVNVVDIGAPSAAAQEALDRSIATINERNETTSE